MLAVWLQAYDPLYGARPLRRWLEHTIMTDLSRMLVAGDLPDESSVAVGVGQGGLTYSVTKHTTAAFKPVANMHQDITKRLRLDALGDHRDSGISEDMQE